MAKSRVVKELVQYLAHNKKLFLLPLLVLLGLVGMVALVAQSQALAPFIYSLF
ncbi:DUF5989 family protein [Spirochaeta africana]|uniref:Uncharacterized protein n=1 Tax=Spirochaeta africana (strain ATCC 700263 / DSM 8902 / Z-7692) TaxID=889378 RepID=H9ULJ2_SPIAZ|nr:DUF5989 family protein [Spirochaeta africana]AFG38385.1 hypothetical protein Spiaf_2353 [Spirochaeta africana DSM 8902]